MFDDNKKGKEKKEVEGKKETENEASALPGAVEEGPEKGEEGKEISHRNEAEE